MDEDYERPKGSCKADNAKTEQPGWLREAQSKPPIWMGRSGWFYVMPNDQYARVVSRGPRWVGWSIVDLDEFNTLVGLDIREEDRDAKYRDGYDECAHDVEDMVGQSNE